MIKNNASEYGLALFRLATESGAQKEIFEDFQSVNDALAANPELMRLLSNPRLSAKERADLICSVFSGRINKYLCNFLCILAEKRICDIIPKCWAEYRTRYCDANNILPVTATTAVPLSDAQCEKLKNKLAAITGSQILLSSGVDPECLGGIRLEYGGKRYDASIQNRLASLKKSLTSDF